MCIKAGDNEIETVKNLMSMSLMAVVADALNVDLDEIPSQKWMYDVAGHYSRPDVFDFGVRKR